MDYEQRLAISYYQTIAVINEPHQIFLVQHRDTKKVFVKKILSIYNLRIYTYLHEHPVTGIPKVIAFYEEAHQLTVIEEYISGTSLQEIMEAHAVSPDFLLRCMAELCDILSHLHALTPPVVHRDIKPSNILITPYQHVVLIDFNAAKYMTDASAPDTVLLGTKGYAAPEQYGFGSSTPQTDIYALGILLRELTAALPDPMTETAQIETVIQRCTQINPRDRYPSAASLKQALADLHPAPAQPVLQSREVPAARSSLLPPGYRTRTPWKMLLASLSYLFIFWLCLSLEVKDTFGLSLWIQRLFCLGSILSVVLITCNYGGIWRYLPLCQHPNRLLRWLGILLTDIILVLALFTAMVLVVSWL